MAYLRGLLPGTAVIVNGRREYCEAGTFEVLFFIFGDPFVMLIPVPQSYTDALLLLYAMGWGECEQDRAVAQAVANELLPYHDRGDWDGALQVRISCFELALTMNRLQSHKPFIDPSVVRLSTFQFLIPNYIRNYIIFQILAAESKTRADSLSRNDWYRLSRSLEVK